MRALFRLAAAVLTSSLLLAQTSFAGNTTPVLSVVATPNVPINFGNMTVGQTAQQTITFTVPAGNGGFGAALTNFNLPAGMQATGGTCIVAAPLVALSFVVPSGGSCTLIFSYAPTANGNFSMTPTFNCQTTSLAGVVGTTYTCSPVGTVGNLLGPFTAFVGTVVVPALSPAGLTALLVVMLALGLWAGLRRRNATH